MAYLDLVALIVEDYDPAIDFFVRVLQLDLIEDVPSTTNDGRPKRWVVVRPVGGTTGILLARADGEHQRSAVGHPVPHMESEHEIEGLRFWDGDPTVRDRSEAAKRPYPIAGTVGRTRHLTLISDSAQRQSLPSSGNSITRSTQQGRYLAV